MLRKARIKDIRDIQKLLTYYANRGEMLSRSLSELYESVRDFYVIEEDGKLLGACALHIMWEDLAEIRSVAVAEEVGRKGLGTKLVTACLDEAHELGLKKVFCLTYRFPCSGQVGIAAQGLERLYQLREIPRLRRDCDDYGHGVALRGVGEKEAGDGNRENCVHNRETAEGTYPGRLRNFFRVFQEPFHRSERPDDRHLQVFHSGRCRHQGFEVGRDGVFLFHEYGRF
ncbi:MAG: argA, partial [Geobacteraceae bacterium]|nr:argA [Geobacteraceae bacterium]